MSSILGISAFYHDSAAALIVDGEIVAAAQEERFTRIKHDANFPLHAIEYCLKEASISPQDLYAVAFYEKPLLKFDRLLETYLAFAPRGFVSFSKALPLWLNKKLHLPREMRKGLNDAYKKRFVFVEHHVSHAASAFFPSPFEEAAILTVDGVGEWATSTFGIGHGNSIELTHEQRFPHSLGLLYSAFTYFCGFKVNSGEYKLMGLAPFGEPRYADVIVKNLIDLKNDGSFRIDMSYFSYCYGLTMTSKKFDKLFGSPPRKPESLITQREMDLAASIQKVTEEIMLRTARHVQKSTGLKRLCLAGGVALNCVANGRILREGPFDDIWIQPSAGDAGGALGAALYTWHHILNNPHRTSGSDKQHGSLLGPRFSNQKICEFLILEQATYDFVEDENELCSRVAAYLEEGKVIGWFQGRMEFGPRALGCRSIIGDARSFEMQSKMNLKIKFRESFRPFAPSILREHAHCYFNVEASEESPYMLQVASIRMDKRLLDQQAHPRSQGIERLKLRRSVLPAITHVDYSARLQTVDPIRNRRFYKLIKQFEARTGCPVVINTSFNIRGEPIVCTPEDAYRCFAATDIDVLVMENYILLKNTQNGKIKRTDIGAHFKKYTLD
jgi:carbamoyltransferase